MAGDSAAMWAGVVAVVVTLSLPFYLYGAWIIIDAETVTWDVLTHHLRFVGIGLALTTIPLVGWMLPRLLHRPSGVMAVHAFLGLQAYAMLIFALTGIVRIFQVKRTHDLYHDPDPSIDISELHENMDAWRFRLRVGVFGYLGFWILAWVVGIIRYVRLYVL